jgi:capsular polysaccharide biosynthesis protein
MDNYFHFLSHIIFTAPLINQKYIDYVLLIPAEIEKKKQYVEALNLFFPKNKIIFCKDSLLINHLIKLDIIITKESIRLFHEFTQKLNLPLKKLYFDKIFVMRNDAKRRILKNQSEINIIANSFGYKSVDCSELSFIDQISYFIHAKYIIGVHGAALGNILFSESLKNMIEILSPKDYSLIYEAIASMKNVNYSSITGTTMNNKEFFVDEKKVKKVLLETS